MTLRQMCVLRCCETKFIVKIISLERMYQMSQAHFGFLILSLKPSGRDKILMMKDYKIYQNCICLQSILLSDIFHRNSRCCSSIQSCCGNLILMSGDHWNLRFITQLENVSKYWNQPGNNDDTLTRYFCQSENRWCYKSAVLVMLLE